ncbi:DUF962 domain-containing protein [Corallincola holothuriorum]|uniref:DUF962 domain-containing protein n=1 Tax=Corallincola holothuriorum TaxID=2282215 RepID=A0A368NEE5_9GAMM|nr:DUF962 domain-containing protein [Corallincola holothuriorum]RCU48858.1 DUF962 domain-containing protein [Corallincola holothuriorum]
MTEQKFESFQQFYPYYLQEHRDPRCRALHYVGSTLVLLTAIGIVWQAQWHYIWLLPVIGYGFAWLGHFAFEHNRPATFKYPLYSLMGDWVMYFEFLCGRIGHRFN